MKAKISYTEKSQDIIQETFDQIGFIKMKKFLPKDTIKKISNQSQRLEKSLQNIWQIAFIQIYKELLEFSKKKTGTDFSAMNKALSRPFAKEDALISVSSWESLHVISHHGNADDTTLMLHYTPSPVATVGKTGNNRAEENQE